MITVLENAETGYWEVFVKSLGTKALKIGECFNEADGLEIAQKLTLWRRCEVSELLVAYLNRPYKLGAGTEVKTVTRYAELLTINGGKGIVKVVGDIQFVKSNRYGRLGLTTHEAMELIGINSTVAGIMSLLPINDQKELGRVMAAMIDIERAV